MNFLFKKILSWRKPKLIFVTGKRRRRVSNLIFDLLKDSIKVVRLSGFQSKIDFWKLIFGGVFLLTDQEEVSIEKLRKLFEIFPEKIVVINSANQSREKKIVSLLSKNNSLLIDYKSADKIPGKRLSQRLTFGSQSKADFSVSDFHDKNFKVNYKGSTVPIWVDEEINKKEVTDIISSLSVGVLLNFNLVDLSQRIKDQSLH